MKRLAVFSMFLWLGIMGASAQKDNCDVNGDGVVNIADVVYVVDHVLGKHDPVAVDLGLPSGRKWADRNVGASKPEEHGGYYAWGEIEEKYLYSQSNYKYYINNKYQNLGEISGTQYDVAYVKSGGKWCMPKMSDYQELLYYCVSEWTTVNNVKGYKLTSKVNGNSIFLPVTGYLSTSSNVLEGYYWSSTENTTNTSNVSVNMLFFSNENIRMAKGLSRYLGYAVRPVVNK